MVLDTQRNKVNWLLDPVAAKLKNVSPNTVSWFGLIFAAISGVVLAFSYDHNILLIVGAIMVIVSGYFDALDGKVAKMFNKTSKRGDYLDHVFDRYADVFMIGGIAVSAWCNPYLGMLALVGTLLTSYMGTQAQAIGGVRLYAGLLGRADRVVLTTLFPIIQFIFTVVANGEFAFINFNIGSMAISLSWLDIMLLYFAVMGNYTAIQRGITIWKNIKE